MIYTPLSQRDEAAGDLLAAIRTTASVPALTAVVDEVRSASKEVAIAYVRSMNEQIDAALVRERLVALLSSAFAVLALLLACTGVYGVTSYDVSRRTRDYAIRLALGADRGVVLVSVLGRAGSIAGVGLVVGVAGALLLAQLVSQMGDGRLALSRLLFGLEPRDPTTLTMAAALLAITAIVAGYFPARRAAGVDPAVALRVE
jgi:ABC-type antimicrobial peptide transport system permease subunit